MKAFLSQGLLIGAAIVAVGCAGPQSNVSPDERLLVAGYPAEYIDGLNAGVEAFCREMFTDKGPHLLIPPKLGGVCISINVQARGEQKPKMSRSHQQGWTDGKALMSGATDAAREAEAQLQMQVQAGSDYMKYQRTMELLNHKK